MEKKYKILGINIIDLLVLAVLIAVVVIAVIGLVGKDAPVSDEKYEFTFSSIEVSKFVVDEVKKGCGIALDGSGVVSEGCRMYDDSSKTDLGTCTYIFDDVSRSNIITDDGEWITASKDDYRYLELKSEVVGKGTNKGIKVGSREYRVGDEIVLRAGLAKIWIRISDIVKVG